MLWQFCQFIPKPAMDGFVTRYRTEQSANSRRAFALSSGLSLPRTSTAPGIRLLSKALSSFRSHQITHCSSGSEETISAAFAQRSRMLMRLASLRSVSVLATHPNRLSSIDVLASTRCSCITRSGRIYPSFGYPRSPGQVSTTAQVATHSQNRSSA